jgi:hypothetical protein
MRSNSITWLGHVARSALAELVITRLLYKGQQLVSPTDTTVYLLFGYTDGPSHVDAARVQVNFGDEPEEIKERVKRELRRQGWA